MEWHSADVTEVLEELSTTEHGLREEEAAARLSQYGANEFKAAAPVSRLALLVKQFQNALVLLLLGAALISGAVGVYEASAQEIAESVLILAIIGFIVLVGFIQEYRASKELEALRSLLSQLARVVRDGKEKEIEAAQLVPGDLVRLEEGERIPADCRIVEEFDARVSEASLTGESLAVAKNVSKVSPNAPIADRKCMLFSGTNLVHGTALAVVVTTGMETELGKIAHSVQEIKSEQTPLQGRLDRLGKQLGLVTIALCCIVFFVGFSLQSKPWLEMFLVAIALAVAAVPEGLPGVVTVALAAGVRRMVRNNVIVRRLTAVETLGSTTVICTDKTGTLTKNKMSVAAFWLDGEHLTLEQESSGAPVLRSENGQELSLSEEMPRILLSAGMLTSNAHVDEDRTSGDPTEVALVDAGRRAGLNKQALLEELPRFDRIDFDSERKLATSVHKHADGLRAFYVGAPDVLLDKSARAIREKQPVELTEKYKRELSEANDELAKQAYRVLAVGCREIEGEYQRDSVEEQITFVGLIAMADPPREETYSAVEECKKAGIRVMMITGDQSLTARSIASQTGIAAEDAEVLTGRELEGMDDESFSRAVQRVSIYARVSPAHKLRIVTALQAQNEVVAMTGDGVNDAPALKKANIGVAMGVAGTDVSREASDMVLLDDNFNSIVAAVREGRGIYDNIRKFFAYLISGNIGEVGIVFLTTIIPGLPMALTASQILLINLVTDGLPALALGVDPFEPDAMSRKPRAKSESIFVGLAPFIVWYPLLMIGVTMLVIWFVYDPVSNNLFETQTVAFLSIVLFESFQAISARSTRFPVFQVGAFKNLWLVGAVLFSLLLAALLLFVPISLPGSEGTLQDAMHVTALSPWLMLTIIAASSLGFVYLEMHKFLRTRRMI